MKTIIATLECSKYGYGVWFGEFSNVFSFGKTVEEAKTNAKEALELAFEGERTPAWPKRVLSLRCGSIRQG